MLRFKNELYSASDSCDGGYIEMRNFAGMAVF